MQTAPAPVRSSRPFPLPSDIAAEQARSVVRAATAIALREVNWPQRLISAEEILKQAWPQDRAAYGLVATKAATAPATTTTSGWAAELVPVTATGAFLSSLGIASAAQRLFAAATRVELTGVGSVRMPYAASTPSLAGSWTAEGAPAVVRVASLSGAVTLGPTKKLNVIAALTNELADHSTPVAEQVIRQVMTEHTAKVLDASVFSNFAGSAAQPPGLLSVTPPLTATAGGGANALVGDLAQLLAALSNAGAGQRVMLFVPPARTAPLAAHVPGGLGSIEVVPTVALASTNTVVAADPSGVFSGYSGEPEITVSKSASANFDDTSPQQLASGAQGSAVPAAPVFNMFQTDSYALILRLRVAFAVRPGFAQHIVGATW